MPCFPLLVNSSLLNDTRKVDMTPLDTIKIDEHGLYKAAVAFMVSGRTEDDAWKDVALFVSQFKGDADGLDAQFAMIEEAIKTDFKVTAMPGKWRSAKTVARKAFALGTTLIDPADKQPYGKSFIEKANAGIPVAISRGEKAVATTTKLVKLLATITWDNDAQRIYVRDQIHSLAKLL